MATDNRPLSPHLQVYRPQLTTILSITHRATGIFLAIGMLLLSYWLTAAGYGAEAFAHAQSLVDSLLGQLLLFAWSWSLFYHLCNGIRHLFWDAGYGFEIPTLYKSGWTVVIVSVVLTLLTWLMA